MTADDSHGWLTNFLAEETELDRQSLWQLGSWAVGSVGALVIAVLAVHSSTGLRRDQIAAADLARQSQQIQSIAREGQTEARRLSSAIDTLNGDRDRLYSRVTVLEQGLDSVTGSMMVRQSVPPSLVMSSTIMLPPPVITAPTTIPAVLTETAPAPQAEAPAPPAAAPQHAVAAATKEPLPASTVYAPPDPSATKLIETMPIAPAVPAKDEKAAPAEVASAPATPEPAAAGAPATEIPVQRTDFGVDLGGANSLDGLRALWRGRVKADASLLSPLRPIVVIRERSNGLGLQLRLVAGPLSDAAAAAKICAALAESDRSCETAVFDGQRLAMRAAKDEPPAASPQRPPRARPAARQSRHEQHNEQHNEQHPPQPAAPQQQQPQPSAQASFLPGFFHSR